MTISGNYAHSAAFSYSAATMRSPEPVTPVNETEPPPSPAPAPEPPPDLPRMTLPGFLDAPPFTESERAAKLFAALDRDGDGSVTKAEFIEVAKDLKRTGKRQAPEGSEDYERSVRRAERLERRLGRLFDRVDANHDGSVDSAELGDALRSLRALQRLQPAGADEPGIEPPLWYASTKTGPLAVQQYARTSQDQAAKGTLETAA